MGLPALSIRHPVLAFMLSAVLVLFGYVGYERIGVDRLPDIDFPIVSVVTVMPGGDPEILDTSVTSIIENSVNSIPGIQRVQSTSSPGTSVVVISFEVGVNVDAAFNDVQAKVNQVVNDLPDDAYVPVVAKVESNAQPILWLAVTGDRTQQQLNQYASNVIAKRLETIDGVGEISVGGDRERTIRVELDHEQMTAYGITTQDLVVAFQREHLQLPGGFLVGAGREAMIKLDLEFHSVRDLQNMIIAHRAGAPVRLHDVADVIDGLADMRQAARYNGQASVGLGIVKIANANTVSIIEEVKRRLETEIEPQLPPGIEVHIASDSSGFILEMVRALEEHLILGTVLAALILWLFLKSIRSTLIIAVGIPVSLLGAVVAMYMFGYTMNTVTLLALLLLVGVVVDDSIVVLENIYRHRETGTDDAAQAAIDGTNEVVFAVLAATLTLVAIFGPVIFMGGIVGMFFTSFGVVVTVGVLASWFVSMTLTPMLASRYLHVNKNPGAIERALENGFRSMERGYRRGIEATLRHRWRVLGIAGLVVLSSVYFFGAIGKTFIPEDDEGLFLVVARTPLGASVPYTDGRLREIEAILGEQPEIESYFTFAGAQNQANSAMAFVRMVPRDQRQTSQSQLIERLRPQLAEIPGIRAFPTAVPMIQGARGEPLQFVVRGPELNEVARLAEMLQARLNEDGRLGIVDLDLQLDLPQIALGIDRERAAALGLAAQDLALAVNILAGGVDIAKYNDLPGDGHRYDIRLKGREGDFRRTEDLGKVFLRNNAGELIRLDTVAWLEETLGPAVVARNALQYAANLFSSPNIPLAEAMSVVQTEAAALMPLGYEVIFQGEAEEFDKTAGYMQFAFLLATVLVYMVLASQFNSFIQPLIIMVAQPLAMIGGLAGLWITGHTLNIFSMIGLVLLVGLVAKNSILLVDMTNQLRARGYSIDAALREACPIRLRPVLMTSLTMILALLPAATGLGAGADTNGPLAVAVIGGMITSTLLTLVVVPAVYSLIENGLERLRGDANKKEFSEHENTPVPARPGDTEPGDGDGSGREPRPAGSVSPSEPA